MKPSRPYRKLSCLASFQALLVLGTVACTVGASAQSERVLYDFTNGTGGVLPFAGVVLDPSGNLYGTTFEGGSSRCFMVGCGVVYKLTPDGGGGWVYSNVYVYLGGEDGDNPIAPPAFDNSGNLYVASEGVAGSGGAVLQLKPNGTGTWVPTLVHEFVGPEGSNPAGLVVDGKGNLFGSALSGGPAGYGTVFELSPNGNGGWKVSVLHAFTGKADGGLPNTLSRDASGNLFGLTTFGGTFGGACSTLGCGVAFSISKNASGQWVETIMHSFTGGSDGYGSNGGNLVVDSLDNVYGASPVGGSIKGTCYPIGCGFVYRLKRTIAGNWIKTDLYEFDGGNDGTSPSYLTLDSQGNIYGTTSTTLFKLLPTPHGPWSESTLATFPAGSTSGTNPIGIPVLDPLGNIYGTTQHGGDLTCTVGGASGCGVVYEVTP